MSNILESHIVHFRSEDAANFGSYPNGESLRSSFSIALKTDIECFEEEMMVISLASAQIPFSFYNTNNTNNYFDYTETNTGTMTSYVKSFQISNGNYNVNEIITEILYYLNLNTSISATYAATWDGKTNKITFTISGNQCVFNFNTGANSLYNLRRQIGFTNHYDITITSILSGTSNTIIDIITNPSLYLRTNISLSNTIATESCSNSDILAKIPINCDPLEQISFIRQAGHGMNYTHVKNVNYFEFRLTDQNGDLIDLGNCIDWEFSIQFDIIEKLRRNNDLKPRVIFPENISTSRNMSLEEPFNDIYNKAPIEQNNQIILPQEEITTDFLDTIEIYKEKIIQAL